MVDCLPRRVDEEVTALRQFNQWTLIVWTCGLLLAVPSLLFLYYPTMVRTKVNYLNIKLSGFLGGRASRQGVRVLTMELHHNARIEIYPRSDIRRYKVPDEKVPWSVEFPGYDPPDYTAPSVMAKPVWADPDYRNKNETSETAKWNKLDGKVNRMSHMSGPYEINEDGVPRNPMGRTGLKGRGLLGRWGPNHAADPIVTRWKRDDNGKIMKDDNGKPILEFICVQRRDNKQWALPGGMVDPGEVVSITLRREFREEAMNFLEATDAEKQKIKQSVEALFSGKGEEIYRGYVDDPRNTDNSWMETVAMNLHDEHGDHVAKFKLQAGDDAEGVKWMPVSRKLELYASHRHFIEKTAEKRNASW